MRVKIITNVFLSCLLSSCMGLAPNQDGKGVFTRPVAHVGNPNCSNLEYLRANVRKIVLPPDISELPTSVLQIMDSELAKQLDLVNAQAIVITGNCAKTLDNFQISDLLSNSQIRLPMSPSDRNYDIAYQYNYDVGPEDLHPLNLPGDFQRALMVGLSDSENGVVQIFLGLWQAREYSTLALFTQDSQGAFSDARPLLRTYPKLKFMWHGITIGSPGGILSLYQETPSGVTIYRIRYLLGAMYSHN